jgi:hypothetical protein
VWIINQGDFMKNYTDEAIELFNQGFNSKASQKRALECLNRSYDDIRRKITNDLLDRRSKKEIEEVQFDHLYWSIPYDLHQFRAKHVETFSNLYADDVKEIQILVELRITIKSAPINKVEHTVNEHVERVEKSLREIYEAKLESYERGLRIARLFNGLPVNVTPHYVNHEGSLYFRCFYYLYGKMTALNETSKEDFNFKMDCARNANRFKLNKLLLRIQQYADIRKFKIPIQWTVVYNEKDNVKTKFNIFGVEKLYTYKTVTPILYLDFGENGILDEKELKCWEYFLDGFHIATFGY